MSQFYILNSAVITAPGLFRYRHISIDEARKWLDLHDWVSTIGYEETAKALQKITKVIIPVNRKVIEMQPGDEALVFRLVFPSGYRPDPGEKGQLSEEFILANCEIGLLKRLE